LVAEGSLVFDSMSGASPLYYNTLSGASGVGVTDYRTAGDFKLTKYFNGMAIGVGAAASSERDYLSRAASLEWRIFSDDRNRTWAFVFGGANDRINPTNGIVVNAPRNTLDFLVGVTQALSANSIVQSNLTYSRGHGYYSDPYKTLDTRPTHRAVFAWLTRYNQYLPAPDATLRLSYRYLRDSFGLTSNAFEATWLRRAFATTRRRPPISITTRRFRTVSWPGRTTRPTRDSRRLARSPRRSRSRSRSPKVGAPN
jgi:hypothetical protein